MTPTTGNIVLKPLETEEFFNDCHSNADGRFCGGPGGAGRVREITDEKTKKEVKQKAEEQKRRNKAADDFSNLAAGVYIAIMLAPVVAPIVARVITVKAKERAINKKVSEAVASRIVNKEAKWASNAGTGRLKNLFNPGASKRPFKKLSSAELDDLGKALGPANADNFDERKLLERARSGGGVFKITAADGTDLYLYDTAGKTSYWGPIDRLRGKPTIKQREMLNSLAYAHEVAPLDIPPRLVLTNSRQGGALGWTYAKKSTPDDRVDIFMNADYVNEDGTSVPEGIFGSLPPGWQMPGSRKVSATHYTVLHEYGHRYDYDMNRRNAGHLFEDRRVRRHLSSYANSKRIDGSDQPWEGYAEAFADWHTTGGKSRNPSTLAYAHDQGWHGTKMAGTQFNPINGRRYVRTKEGADRFGVPIGSIIPEAEDIDLDDIR